MSVSVAPVAIEGPMVRMFAGFDWWRSMTVTGRFGRNSDAEIMLFDAARSIVSADLFAGFWRDEARGMDWLQDFLCDPHMGEMVESLLAPEIDEEEVEEEFHYDRRALCTLGSDVVEDT